MSARNSAIAVLLVAVSCTGCVQPQAAKQPTDSVGASEPPFSGEVLLSARDGNDLELYAANMATGELRQLTDNDYDDSHATWSPDGDSILYVTSVDKASDLAVLPYDGGAPVLLTRNSFAELWPQYLPSGDAVIYASNQQKADSPYQLINMDLASGEMTPLSNAENGVDGFLLAPDGSAVAYVTPESRNRTLLEIQSLETGEMLGSTRDREDLTITGFGWSPDSTRIAFSARVKRSDTHLFVWNLQSGLVEQLTEGPGVHAKPVWRQDGQAIFFLGAIDRQQRELHEVSLATKKVRRVTDTSMHEADVSTRNDLVALTRFDDGNFSVYVVDPVSGGTRRVAPDLDGIQLQPQLRPRRKE